MYAEPIINYIALIDLTTVPLPQMLPNGYLISSNAEYYEPGILTLAEATKHPATLGELLSLGSVVMMNSYAGTVLVITGDSDLPYCGSDCLATGGAAASIPAEVKMNFFNVSESNFSAVVQLNTGYSMNLHYNATGAYAVMNNFPGSKGLASS
ncbi:hypothetical protein BKA61DRAFT_583259 [Leptodontidium sp. MPI-SDFR-AT-0119]|nr:hypothetical protein BKA61DRAFT_583259 [Leptodontidium sp. MPI-SDFR-AT-0119]